MYEPRDPAGQSYRTHGAAEVRLRDEAALEAKVKSLPYPVGILLDGLVEHGTYHGGQIALLKKTQ